ncbi:ML domain-containing protein [Actinokineospora terrae]|uniref:ML domain-containing protein n=1 Tax=Actinokineospora terrae TaxID=155974 RepID=A0A1H9X7J5_9PSEU|nr:ML domain-containing protein [Actinokineospora terrae]SES42110.1 ML domain-containing protein [Actinokineospora terrae]
MRVSRLFAVAAVFGALVSVPGTAQAARSAFGYVDCGVAADPFQLDSLTVTPDPPVPGQRLTVDVGFRVTERIEVGASAAVTAKVGLVTLLRKVFDIDEELKEAGGDLRLPLEPGSYRFRHDVDLPREIPATKFAIVVRGSTADDDELLCLDLWADFSPGR